MVYPSKDKYASFFLHSLLMQPDQYLTKCTPAILELNWKTKAKQRNIKLGLWAQEDFRLVFLEQQPTLSYLLGKLFFLMNWSFKSSLWCVVQLLKQTK